MGRTDPRVHAGHAGGGSLALADVLEDHAEAIFIDLLKVYGFDLAGFLRGEVAGSPRLITAMIRNLPEGTNYVAKLKSAPEELPAITQKKEPEIDPFHENLMWTTDRMLMAQLINSVNMLVRHTIPWGEGNAPDFPLVGPATWNGKKESPKPVTVADALNNIMGHRKT